MTEQPQERNESDVRAMLSQIDAEYQSASLALSGLALGTSMHEFITARLERIEDARQKLVNLVEDEEQAKKLVCEQLDKSGQEPKGDTNHAS